MPSKDYIGQSASHVSETVRARAARIACHITETGCTVREAAAWAGVSRTTAWLDCTRRAPKALREKAIERLEANKAARHVRGGQATRNRWETRRRAHNGEPEACNGEPVTKQTRSG